MEFLYFLKEMLGITDDFGIVNIEKIERPEKIIRIYLNYLPRDYALANKRYSIYDFCEEREWQHLSWFDYKCYIVCRLPRYINKDKKVTVIEPNFAPKGRSYTHLFSAKIITLLQSIRVQKTVAEILQTTPYIVRSVMEDAVQKATDERGAIADFENISIDEKAYSKGHKYATILIDSDREYVIDMHEDREEKSLETLMYMVSEQETQPQIKRVNIDMWQPYMNIMTKLAPQALLVHDKFHLIKKLSEAINKTRQKEVVENDLLKKQKYTVLKNAENRTPKQDEQFKLINEANLKTAQAWHIRENFKLLFDICSKQNAAKLLEEWIKESRAKSIYNVNLVLKTFENHLQGIINAIITRTSSGLHENMNGKIQSVIAKARGFINFDRFRINVLFYFGNLKLTPQKI
jgi:transposase